VYGILYSLYITLCYCFEQVIFDACILCHKVFSTHTDFVAHIGDHRREDDYKLSNNTFGTVFVPLHKRKKPKHVSTTPAQVQDIMMWHQGYHTNYIPDNRYEQELHIGNQVLASKIAQASAAHDGVSVDIDQLPTNAITCKICGLLFASSHQINKHVSFSQKHKRAVDKQRRDQTQQLWEVISGDDKFTDNTRSYRDRSEERRTAIPEAGQQICYELTDEVIEYAGKDAPITSSNKGHKLLLSMGKLCAYESCYALTTS
jgi:uncharacterized C2H2 Zn-finger protein